MGMGDGINGLLNPHGLRNCCVWNIDFFLLKFLLSYLFFFPQEHFLTLQFYFSLTASAVVFTGGLSSYFSEDISWCFFQWYSAVRVARFSRFPETLR